jgi:plastocyanin
MRNMRGAVTVVALVLSACGGGSAPTQTNTGGGGGGGGGGSTSMSITISDNSFDPSATTVPIGSTITWTWTGAAIHNVTFANSSIAGASNRSSGTFQKAFPSAGTFGYTCTNHPGMAGSITVQ